MPKQARPIVDKPKTSAKKAKKQEPAEPKTEPIPELPLLHAAQLALYKRGKQFLKADGTVLVVGKYNQPNTGKTRTAGALARWWALKQVKAEEKALVLFGATTMALALEHAAEMGVRKRFAGFTLDKPRKAALATELEAHGHAAISVTRTMLHKLLNPSALNKWHGVEQQLLVALALEVGATRVCLVLDEAHQLYKTYTKMPCVLEALHTHAGDVLTVTVIGLSATPGFDRKACRDGAVAMFGALPPLLEYEETDLASLKTELQVLPNEPTTWTTDDVGTPIGVKDSDVHELLTQLHQDIVDVLMAPARGEAAKIAMRDQRNRTLNKIVAALAHGTAGGMFVSKVTEGEVKVRKAGGGAPLKAKESVLVAHKTQGAECLHLNGLRDVQGKKINSNPLCVIDLGVELNPRHVDTLLKAKEAMIASFQAQKATTVGFLTKRQHAGNNDFAKVATTVCAIGFDWSDDELRQLFARVGRMGGTLEADELVPVAYRALYLKCDWASKVANMESAPVATTVAIPADLSKTLKEIKAACGFEYEEIYANVQKLLLADAYLKTKGTLARKYLDAERAEYESREKGGEEEEGEDEGDDAMNDKVLFGEDDEEDGEDGGEE